MKRLFLVFVIALLPMMLTGSSLPTLKYRALDPTGNPISGAKLYFYETGTVTPLATYSDQGLTSANTNPVVADLYGWFGEIYLKTDKEYTVVLKNAAGTTTYWTLNNIDAVELAQSALVTRINQIASNPLYYGAVGDGVADESSYVQSAITNATGTVDLLGKIYRCDSVITIPSGITLKNGTLDFTNCSASNAVTLTGTVGSANLTGAITAGDTTFTVASATGIVAGDWLLLEDDSVYTIGYSPSELVQVLSIAGTTVTPTNPIKWSYATGSNAKVYDITPVTGVVIDNVTFLHSATATDKSILKATYATNITIKNSTFDGASLYGAWLLNSADITIDRCEFSDNKAATATGILLSGATRDTRITNSRFSEDSLMGVYAFGEPVRSVLVENCLFSGPTNGVVLGHAENVRVDKCIFEGGTRGVYLYGAAPANFNLTNSIFTGMTYPLYGATIIQAEDGKQIISGNKFNTTVTIASDGYNLGNSSWTFSDNYFANGGLSFTFTAGTGTLRDININNNTIHSGGITITGDGTPTINNCNISGNILSTSDSATPISATYCAKLIVAKNSIQGDATNSTHGIYSASSTYANIADNNISALAAGGEGIDTRENTNITISNNTISAAATGIETINTSQEGKITVVGNNVTSADEYVLHIDAQDTTGSELNISGNSLYLTGALGDYVIRLHGYINHGTINGNILERDGDDDNNIALFGDAAGAITNLSISGNTFKNGDYAVGEDVDANATNVFASGNLLNSVTTSIAEYTINHGRNIPNYQSTYAFAGQNISGGGITVVDDGGSDDVTDFVELYDYGSAFNNTTGVFTAPVDGFYDFSWNVSPAMDCTGGATTDELWFCAVLNFSGSVSATNLRCATLVGDRTVSQNLTVGGSDQLEMTAGQTAKLQYSASENTAGLDCTGTITHASFKGHIATPNN